MSERAPRHRRAWRYAKRALTPTRRRAKRAVASGLVLLLASLAAIALVPLPKRLSSVDSPVITWRDGQPAHVFLAPDERWRVAIDPDRIDPAYIHALLTLEDQRFWSHPGVDPVAILRAVQSNLTRGRVVSGASTLTMQLVRMVEPRPRTLRSKLIEAARAIQLEARLSKREILAHYLRFVPYGRNLEGVEAASLAYFGHDASALTAEEIATLLAVPQAPNKRYPTPAHADTLMRARDEIARSLHERDALPARGGATPDQALAQALAAPVPHTLTPFPREVPHLAIWLRQRHPHAARLETTLDASTQRLAEQMLRAQHASRAARGVHHGVVVVLDHATMQARAVVGNIDFFDSANGSQLPGFDIARSTGSLLKPLLLALSIDAGLTHPAALAEDVPLQRAGYAPRNFDGQFNGLVRMDDALTRSLNIPFVRLLEALGLDVMIQTLTRAGLRHLNHTPGHYGLNLAIGGVEATPLELAALHAALARGGAYAPPRLLRDAPVGAPVQLVSEAAAHLVQRALEGRARPDAPARERGWRVAWKTGTSNGLRDAWSIGSGPTLTAAVWFGNFDNTAREALVGGELAAPVMFDILEALEARSADAPRAPEDLQPIQACAYSGHPVSPACPQQVTIEAPTRSVMTTPCPYHAHILVDAQTGERVTPACAGARATEQRAITQHPPALTRWLINQRGHESTALPPWAPGCAPLAADEAPEIISPPRDRTIRLIPGLSPQRQQLALEAAGTPHATLSWFIDGKFLGQTRAGERLWWAPEAGEHQLVVMDEAGRASGRPLVVEAAPW